MASYDNLHRHERPELYVRDDAPRWYGDRPMNQGPGRELPKRDRDFQRDRNDDKKERSDFRGPRTDMNYSYF